MLLFIYLLKDLLVYRPPIKGRSRDVRKWTAKPENVRWEQHPEDVLFCEQHPEDVLCCQQHLEGVRRAVNCFASYIYTYIYIYI